jgi:penicillin-binding protein-related factor A (putative recombinase)
MAAKIAEMEFKQLANRLGWWSHKWQDVRYCPNCHQPIFVTRRMQGEAEQRSSIVDYLVFIGSTPMWVECKGGHVDRIAFNELEDHQKRFLADWEKRGVEAWLFFLIGKNRINAKMKPRKAYFFPYYIWEQIEHQISDNRKSLNYDLMQIYLGEYELVFESGSWLIPTTHVMGEIVS